MSWEIRQGDALTVLRTLPEASVNCCITSPPYWGLRDYGTGKWEGGAADCDHKQNHGIQGKTGQRADRTFTAEAVYKQKCRKCGAVRVDKQLGLEKTPQIYIKKIVSLMSEVRRVLRDDGTLWLNLGDTYCNSDKWGGGGANTGKHTKAPDGSIESWKAVRRKWSKVRGLKPKDLVGIPWRVAFALQGDGWWLRSDIIWAKPAPMPESVTDRPTRSHEYIFLLAKSEKYYCDMESVKEPAVCGHPSGNGYKRDARLTYQDGAGARGSDEQWKPRPSVAKGGFAGKTEAMADTGQNAFRAVTEMRNLRDVWTVDTQPFTEAHFATFPPRLIEPCVIAGCPPEGLILDPFSGAGTTGLVAQKHQRNFLGIELNPDYIAMAERRLAQGNLFDVNSNIG